MTAAVIRFALGHACPVCLYLHYKSILHLRIARKRAHHCSPSPSILFAQPDDVCLRVPATPASVSCNADMKTVANAQLQAAQSQVPAEELHQRA